MRVPWRDRAWDKFICDDPLGNSSCTLLANIGPRRVDIFEAANAAAAIDTVDQDRLPCLSERATFMSPVGYTVNKTHPYSWHRALKDRIHPTAVSLPGFAFEAVPFRWLNRATLAEDVKLNRVPEYNASAEDRVDAILGFDNLAWVMDGRNQRAVIDAFFEPVVADESLVFVYLKHSPLQEQRNDRLLVGAAMITRVTPPAVWNETGSPPFSSSMWETIVEHSLRPDMNNGILLPYQQLVPLLDEGVDIDAALAWAPEGRHVEFSYVTEHLSDDAAIEALAALERAALGMRRIGVEIPDAALHWLTKQTERLWQVRGSAPGLAAVLATVGVTQPHVAARAVTEQLGQADPWPSLERWLADPNATPAPLRQHLSRLVGRVWSKLPGEWQRALRLLSGFDVTTEQVRMLTAGETDVELSVTELLENPYFAATCTYGMLQHVPFATVDRAFFPPTHVAWKAPAVDGVALEEHLDRRRIEALLTDVLEQQGAQGDTVVPQAEAIDLANARNLSQPPALTEILVAGLDLDHDSVIDWPDWSPLTSVLLADESPAYKLTRYEETSRVIRDWIGAQEKRAGLGALTDARSALDAALDRDRGAAAATADDKLEERARTEKAAGLSALHDAALSVLIGPAGTGKTTLLRALVDFPDVADGGVLLLAPTGKARVQLETKVGRPAKTLASFLASSSRYDGETGRYLVQGESKPRRGFGLVVIDEASMLTEEMLAATFDAFTGVKRMILVGDPRQLPPIGAGRPFVDLVNKLRPDTFTSWYRVGAGYVELQVPRRQLPDGSRDTRHDLELASWFGDGGLGAGDDAIWDELTAEPNRPTVRYVPWGGRTAVQALTDIMQEELVLDARHPDAEWAFALTYGATVNGEYLNWELGAGPRAEKWQILAPTRSRAFGTVELNRHVKRTYRASDTRFAQRSLGANIPKPIGPELIVRGDKVMQTVNRRQKAYPQVGGLDYVANGEIGVGIGRVIPTHKRPKSALSLDVEFSSQPSFQYGYRPTSREDVALELAWAVTVHKSQGSEFGMTFLVLPARAAVSRELMYTALTRQRDRVVILHEGTLADLRELAQPWRSETSRRLTDLFTAPQPVSLTQRGQTRRYDRKLMHMSVSGIPMASKNEVIIAGILDKLAPGRWEYERPYTGDDGREVLPDFTVSTADGRTVIWEHAGMLGLPDYARKWELKRAWYANNGFLPHTEGGGPNGVLMWTEDLNGADAQHWSRLAAEVLGVADTESSLDAGRRPVKKAALPRR